MVLFLVALFWDTYLTQTCFDEVTKSVKIDHYCLFSMQFIKLTLPQERPRFFISFISSG